MNWLTSYVRPKISALVNRKDMPDNLWQKCGSCSQMIYQKELELNLNVCPHCDHHLRMPITARLEMLFDGGEYQCIELPQPAVDPLKFKDKKKYTDRLKEYQAKTSEKDAIKVAHGKIDGRMVVVAAFNFAFMGGSMGMAVGEGILAAAKLAVVQEAPLVTIPASGGARMQEGILSLMQMPRSIIAVDLVREAGLPYVKNCRRAFSAQSTCGIMGWLIWLCPASSSKRSWATCWIS